MTSFPRLRIYALLLVAMTFWAGNPLIGRLVREDIGPFSLAFFRWSGAALLLLPFTWRGIVAEWPAIRQHWRIIALIGFLGIGCFNAFLYSGLRTSTATNATLLQAAVPVLVVLCNYLFFRARAVPMQLVGFLISGVGTLLIIFRADLSVLLAFRFVSGDILFLISALVWAIYTALLRKRPPVSPLSFLTLTFLAGVATMAPLAIIESFHQPIRWNATVLGGIAYTAVFPSIIAYFLYDRGVSRIGPAAAGQLISLQPLLGALLAALLLSEPLHHYHFGGMVVILIGILVAARSQPGASGRNMTKSSLA